jgi:hypothetical protein
MRRCAAIGVLAGLAVGTSMAVAQGASGIGGNDATRTNAQATNAAGSGTAMPPVQHAGDVAYVTGGIGVGEADAMKQAMARYPLAVEIVQHEQGSNLYTAGADVQISRDGRTVLETRAQGPFVLADLPPGVYQVEVMLNGKTQRRQASVGSRGNERALFVFRDQG